MKQNNLPQSTARATGLAQHGAKENTAIYNYPASNIPNFSYEHVANPEHTFICQLNYINENGETEPQTAKAIKAKDYDQAMRLYTNCKEYLSARYKILKHNNQMLHDEPAGVFSFVVFKLG